MAEAETAWRAAGEPPRAHGAKLDQRYRAARDTATRRIAELASRASQARYDALDAALALCAEREASGETAPELDERWAAIEQLPEVWKKKLDGRFRSAAAAKPAESLPDLLLNLEAACGLESPPEFAAARQRLKLLQLKSAMEARRAVVTTPEDIERWLLEAAATPHPDGVSRDRLGRIIAAVRQRRR
jgi:hypothetical protein